MRKIVLSVSVLFSSLSCINAQSFMMDVIGSSGTFASSGSGSMSWTIGEVMTETYSSSGNFFTQGFHQSDTAFIITLVPNFVSHTLSIYPNPVIDNLVIDFSTASENYNHTIEILDMKGQLLRKEYVSANQQQLNVSFHEFANGIYLLNIVNAGSNTRNSYKIIKAE